MYPTLTSFRPPSGMRCDTRLLSSFITGALTATTVTLFLLRVVPGTYVVLPCDPTITARPILMEEYFDRVDKQQEVFPDDNNLIDTRPLHLPAVIDVVALQPHKKPKHKSQKKRKSQQQKKDSTVNNINAKEKSNGPKDLQQQLLELQEKEERETALKGSLRLVEQKRHLQQKNKLQQEKQQIKHHLKEIQLHLQQQAEEMKQKQHEEKERKMKEQRKRLQESQRQSRQKENTTFFKQFKDKLLNKINNQIKSDQTTVKARKESHLPEAISHTSKDNKDNANEIRKKPPDSKLLRSIMSVQKTNSERHPNLQDNNLQLQRSRQYQYHQHKEPREEKLKPIPPVARVYHKVTDTSVPKLSRIVRRNVNDSPPLH